MTRPTIPLFCAAPAAPSRSPLLLLLLAAVVVPCCFLTQQVAGQGVLVLQVSGYVAMTADERNSGTVQHSATNAQLWCNDHGGSLIADSRTEITQTIQRLCMNEGRSLCTTFLDGSAKPRPGSTNGCVAETPSTTSTPNSFLCTYRWRFGFYDAYAETYGDNGMIQSPDEYEPGMCFFKGLYADTTGYTGTSQICNGFLIDRVWNSSTVLNPTAYPRGKFQPIAGATSTRYYRMDSDEIAVDYDPNPLNSFTVNCYLQDYPLPALSTTKQPQPAIVRGYKDLTWAQKNWWVIYLIIALVVLAIVLLIVIYCTVTSRPEKVAPFVHPLVQREREGKNYVYMEDDSRPQARGVNMAMPMPMPMPMQQQPDYLFPNETPQQRAMRLGKGFTMADPEEAKRGNVAIYGTADLAQHGECSSFAGDDDDERRANEDALNALGARKLAEAGAAPKPEPVAEPPAPVEPTPAPKSPVADDVVSLAEGEVGPDSNAPSIKSRRSARRGRGRTSSQTFSEIEVPQAEEINEMNIEL